MKNKLTNLQRRCCEIYHSMKHQNQAKAYRLAGSKSRGKTLIEEAHRTLKKPQCQAYLRKLQKRSEERAVKTAAEIIAELEKVAFSNIKDYIQTTITTGESKKGKNTAKIALKALVDMTDDQLAAVSEISETGGKRTLKLYDKLKALKDLGLRFGIFPTKIEHTGEITLAQAVHNAMKGNK